MTDSFAPFERALPFCSYDYFLCKQATIDETINTKKNSLRNAPYVISAIKEYYV